MSTGCKSSHNGFLDVSRSNGGLRISGLVGQLSRLKIFSTSLSVAAFLHRAGGSMLESTGSHGRGVELGQSLHYHDDDNVGFQVIRMSKLPWHNVAI